MSRNPLITTNLKMILKFRVTTGLLTHCLPYFQAAPACLRTKTGNAQGDWRRAFCGFALGIAFCLAQD